MPIALCSWRTGPFRTIARWRAPAVGALVAACLSAAACDEKLSDVAGPTPNLSPTFASIQREIFQNTAPTGCVNCHTTVGRPPDAGMSLLPDRAYAALVGVPSAFKPGATRVIPGDPDNSYLVQKLEGHSGIVGLRMPFNGPPYLTDGQISIIREWIRRGAENN
jgi:hypothetical protein